MCLQHWTVSGLERKCESEKELAWMDSPPVFLAWQGEEIGSPALGGQCLISYGMAVTNGMLLASGAL